VKNFEKGNQAIPLFVFATQRLLNSLDRRDSSWPSPKYPGSLDRTSESIVVQVLSPKAKRSAYADWAPLGAGVPQSSEPTHLIDFSGCL
jgi:hypothetical protein